MKTRNDFGRFLTECGCVRVAEIGVLRGEFSAQILSQWSGELVLVDSWRRLDGYIDISNVTDREHISNMKAAIAAAPGATVIRGLSVEVASRFEDGHFDAVYIDANHEYSAVMADLAAWEPKVREGGIVAGHDYLDGVLPEGHFGVKRAVLDYFGREPDIVTLDKWPTWVVMK